MRWIAVGKAHLNLSPDDLVRVCDSDGEAFTKATRKNVLGIGLDAQEAQPGVSASRPQTVGIIDARTHEHLVLGPPCPAGTLDPCPFDVGPPPLDLLVRGKLNATVGDANEGEQATLVETAEALLRVNRPETV